MAILHPPSSILHPPSSILALTLLDKGTQQIDGHWKDSSGVLLRRNLYQTLEKTELQGHGVFSHDLGRIRQLLGGLKFSVRMNDLSAPLPLRLRFLQSLVE